MQIRAPRIMHACRVSAQRPRATYCQFVPLSVVVAPRAVGVLGFAAEDALSSRVRCVRIFPCSLTRRSDQRVVFFSSRTCKKVFGCTHLCEVNFPFYSV